MAHSLEVAAMWFAYRAHGHHEQVRKYTGKPYFVHPAAVVDIVSSVPHTQEMLAAAWLHDTVEDCAVSLQEIESLFGKRVATLVENITDIATPSDGNRAARKDLERAHLALAYPDAQTIKLADLIDNTSSIVHYDPSFAKIYMAEKRLLLEVLVDGNPTLWNRANALVEAYYA